MTYLDNVALLRKGYDAMAAGDAETVVAMFADDGVMHIDSRGPFAGDHRGHPAIAQTLAGLFEMTGGTMRMDVDEIFADDRHGIVVLDETATRARDGATLSARETHLFRFADGRIIEMWDIPAPEDKDAHDSFFV